MYACNFVSPPWNGDKWLLITTRRLRFYEFIWSINMKIRNVTIYETKKHSSRMCTTQFSDSREVSLQRPPRQRPQTETPLDRDPPWQRLPWQRAHPLDKDPLDRYPQTETPQRNMGPETKTPLEGNLGPSSQTGSDIIQRPPPPVNRMIDTHLLTLPQTLFADGNKHFDSSSILC